MKTLSKPVAAMAFSLLALVLLPLGGAAAAGVDVNDFETLSRITGLHPSTTTRALDAVQVGRQPPPPPPSSSFLRDVVAASSSSRHLQEESTPSYLFVQMADDCTFQRTARGNVVLKSRRFHGDTVMFSDRPFTYEAAIPTETFLDNFPDIFNADNGGMPNAAITLVQNDESKDVVVSVFAKAVVNGPTYVYKLEQSDEQASVESLSDVLGGKDKMTYDHCSIFIDSGSCSCFFCNTFAQCNSNSCCHGGCCKRNPCLFNAC